MTTTLEPTAQRRQHGNVVRSAVIADSAGNIGHPWHCRSVLDNLLARREISGAEHTAGVQFGEIARRAAVPTLQAADLLRSGRGTGRDAAGNERARRQLGLALDALGGLGAPMGSLAWDVLGRDESLSAWACRQTWIGGRGTGAAKGVLMATLSMLALHFGLTRAVITKYRIDHP